uniref:Pleckstrin homology domain containing A7 n=1 Tax=Tetraodon nigroviridis TaxID=99883 RepID=H3CH41_TETNG
MAAPLGRDSLPGRWSYGVCRDGRVFFIDDDTQTTTWLHPRSGDPVNSGHMIRSDLPRGWEEGFTVEGVSFFIKLPARTCSPSGPSAARLDEEDEEASQTLRKHEADHMTRPQEPEPSRSETAVGGRDKDWSAAWPGPPPLLVRASTFRNRRPSEVPLRFLAVPVSLLDVCGPGCCSAASIVVLLVSMFFVSASMTCSSSLSTLLPTSPLILDLLLLQACHAGMRSFTYQQSSVIGSQAEHSGMRTYFFSADTQEDMNTWLKAMKEAARMQNSKEAPSRLSVAPQLAVPQANHVGANAISAPHLDSSRTLVQDVLEPIHQDAADCCSLRRDSPAAAMFEPTGTVLDTDPHVSLPAPSALPPPDALSASAPVSRFPSRAPSRSASTLPSGVCARNGARSTPSPILEPQEQLKRRSPLEQVEQWIQVQKADSRALSRDNTIPRRTPPTQHKFQTLPRSPGASPPPGRQGEYRYAQDRLSHFRLTPEQGRAAASATVLQLYEWQQRHQFRHGSPTAPLYTPAPEYPFGPRPPSAVPPSLSAPRPEGQPRCVSVPPSPADIPPPGPPPGTRGASPFRRPHTPAERLTIRPEEERWAEPPFTISPRRSKSQLLKAATLDRHSTPSGYITHTVSAPSLHGKTADDTYMQLKKDLEHLDLKVAAAQVLKEASKPVRVAESDVDVKLSRLCEQDKILKDLEVRISSLKEDKDKLEHVLDLSRQQMEQYRDQPGHRQKIAYQQRLLQEDLVSIRAQISRVSTEMTQAWEEYGSLEASVEQLRDALQARVGHGAAQQASELKRELWRIEDVLAGLSASKANFRITIESVQNPERKFVPLMSDLTVPSRGAEGPPPPGSSYALAVAQSSSVAPTSPLPPASVKRWFILNAAQSEDVAPPRPPLPRFYDYGDVPPEVPPLPKEASVIRHTSVRGLKRQSDERRRDRESGQYVANGDAKSDLRSYRSEPELPGTSLHPPDTEYQRFQSKGQDSQQVLVGPGPPGSYSESWSPGHHPSTSVSSYVTLRRGPGSSASRERPHSALELSSSENLQPRGRMTAEEQLERMKRHQGALPGERRRTLSQGEQKVNLLSSFLEEPMRSQIHGVSSRLQAFDWLEQQGWADGQSEDVWTAAEGWSRPTGPPTGLREADVEPVDYDLDISRELSTPQKVPIPERYVESDPEEPPSPEELEERRRRSQRIRSLLARSSSVQNLQPSRLDASELDGALQQQERIFQVSQVLASEASRRSKLVAARAAAEP